MEINCSKRATYWQLSLLFLGLFNLCSNVLDAQSPYQNKFSGDYYMFEKDGKWGIHNKCTKEVKLPAAYDEIKKWGFYLKNIRFAAVRKGKKWGVVNMEEEQVLPYKYEDISFVGNTGVRIKIKRHGHWGMADTLGNVMLKCKYDTIGRWPIHNGLVLVGRDNKWGLFDIYKRELVVSPVYDKLKDSQEGSFKVSLNGKTGLMDLYQHIIFPIEYEDVKDYYQGVAKVKINGKWGLADTNGKMLLPARYDEILNRTYNDDNQYRVKLNGKLGLIGKDGIEVLPPLYDKISGWPPTTVELDGKWAYINKDGNRVTPFKYDLINFWNKNLIAVKTGDQWQFINTRGQGCVIGTLSGQLPGRGRPRPGSCLNFQF